MNGRRVARGAAVAVLVAACSGRDTTEVTLRANETLVTAPFVVSGWYAGGSAPLGGGGSPVGASLSSGVVYVGLAPGSIAGATQVTIHVRSTGAAWGTPAVDGGFDPVAVIASPNDTLDISVSTTNAESPITFVVPVPKHGHPVVIRTSPPAGKRDVPLNTDVVVVFSEPIAAASVSGNAIQLAAGSVVVAGQVAIADSTRLTVRFLPSRTLAPMTEYALTISGEVQDDDRQSMAAPVLVDFTTTDATASVAIDQSGFAGFGGALVLDVNQQVALTATVKDSSGAVLSGRPLVWASNSASIAVSTDGVVTAVAGGCAIVSATVDGKSDAREVDVVPGSRAFLPFRISVAVDDSGGAAAPGAHVEVYYRGPGTSTCATQFHSDGEATGWTDGSGTLAASLLADPDGFDRAAGAGSPDKFLNTVAYIEVHKPYHQTERRFVQAGSSVVTQRVHLQAIKQLTAGDSLLVAVAPTDPVYQQLDTTPAADATFVCQSLLVRAPSDGVLTVSAQPAAAGGPIPYVELANADDDICLSCLTNNPSLAVHAGDFIEIRVATKMMPGDSPRSFMVRTTESANK